MKKADIFKMPSGAELHACPAEFVYAGALMQAVLKQMAGLKLSQADLQKDIQELKENPTGVMSLVDKAINMASSSEIRDAVFNCCSVVKYSPRANSALIPVERSLFDDPEFGMQAREDYYTIMYRVVEVNCKPFFVKTFSGLLRPKPQATVAQA